MDVTREQIEDVLSRLPLLKAWARLTLRKTDDQLVEMLEEIAADPLMIDEVVRALKHIRLPEK